MIKNKWTNSEFAPRFPLGDNGVLNPEKKGTINRNSYDTLIALDVNASSES